MKLKYLLVLGLLTVGCKNGEALAPQTANTPPPAPTPVATVTPAPTFTQCAESGWDWSKEKAGEAYQAGLKAYHDYQSAHPDKDEDKGK